MKITALLPVVLAASCLAVYAQEVINDTAHFSTSNRFLDKDFPKVRCVPSLTVLDSFERDLPETLKDWMTKGVETVRTREHATDGDYALEVKFLDDLGAVAYRPHWQNYWESQRLGSYRLLFSDELRLDVFNPGKAVRLVVKTRDDYVKWWVERSFELKTGANEIAIPRRELLRDMFRTGKVLYNTLLRVEGDKPATLYFDHLRLIGPGIGENMIRHAKCFHFGSLFFTRPHFSGIDGMMESQVYTKERGFGWESAAPGNPKPAGINWREPDSELLRGGLRFNRPFVVDLPNGTYRLHLLEAFRGYGEPLPGSWDLSIRINGGEAKLLRRGAKSIAEFAKLQYGDELNDWYPGQDKWDVFAAKIFRPLECDFEVTGRLAKIELVTDPPGHAKVCFMIIYPLEKAPLIEPEIAALWRDIKLRFNEAYEPFTREMAEDMCLPAFHDEYLAPEIRAKKKAALRIDKASKTRGWMTFAREPVDEVYPDTVPLPAECKSAFSAFGSPGERETITVNVFALRDVPGAKLEVGDFVSSDGATIPADAADVRIVGYCYRMNGEITHGDWKYMVLPWYLVRRDAIDIPSDTSRRFWINVAIPPDASPGLYRSKGVLTATSGAREEIELALAVLPFRLDAVPSGKEFCAIFDSYLYDRPLDEKIGRLMPKGDPTASDRCTALAADLARTTGTRIRAHFDMARRYGFTSVSVASVPEGLDVGAIRVVNYLTKEGAAGMKTLGALRDLREKRVAAAKLDGSRILLNGRRNLMVFQEGSLYRFENGFLLWRLGADGVICGPWQFYFGDPYSPFDGHKGEPGWFVAYSSSNWPTLNPALILEGAGEGIKDYRYVAMLERLAAAKKGTPEAAKAHAYLADLRQRIHPNAAYYFTYIRLRDSGGSWSTQKGTAWRGPDFAAERRRIAELIVSLLN